MLPQNGFFQRNTGRPVQPDQSIDTVNGRPFYAVAVAIIDNVKKGARFSDEVTKALLKPLLHHFSSFSNQSYTAPAELLRQLMSSSRKSELISCLAYVLRQTAIDTMLADPLTYREQLSDFGDEVTEGQIRETDALHSPRSLVALAMALKMNITLSYEGPGKELRARQIYNGIKSENGAPFRVQIQVQDDAYCIPCVHNKEQFSHVALTKGGFKFELTPTAMFHNALGQVHQANDALWESYQQHQKRLVGMIARGELSEHMLRDLYISVLPNADDTRFINKLERSHLKRGASPLHSDLATSGDAWMRIKRLSQHLSLGRIDEDTFYEALEHPKAQHRSSPAA